MKSAPSVENRAARRIRVNREFDSLDALLPHYVTDLTKESAFVRTLSPLDVGTQFSFEFSLVIDDVDTIEGEATVIRVSDAGQPLPGMAVRFDTLTERSRELVDAVLARAEEAK